MSAIRRFFANLFSRSSTPNSHSSDDLTPELVDQHIDTNNDGILSKEEIYEYINSVVNTKNTEISAVVIEKNLLSEENAKLKAHLQELQVSNEKYRQNFDALNIKYDMLIDEIKENEDKALRVSHISNSAIDDFVDSLLADPNINLKYVPDAIERKVYTESMKLFLSSIEKVFKNVGLELVGHKIHLSIEPNE